MTVTKQQQLEWMANKATWGDDRTIAYMMSRDEIGLVVGLLTRLTGAELLAGHSHIITREEWQRERDKMQKKAERVAQPAPGRSWHERGEFPPAGCECEAFVSDENKWMHFEVIAIRDGSGLWCKQCRLFRHRDSAEPWYAVCVTTCQ